MHYFCLDTFNILSLSFSNLTCYVCLCFSLCTYPSLDSLGFRELWVNICVVSELRSFQPCFFQIYFQNFFFYSLSWTLIMCTLECLIVSPKSLRIYFSCFFRLDDSYWFIFKVTYSISNLLWNWSSGFFISITVFFNSWILYYSFNFF